MRLFRHERAASTGAGVLLGQAVGDALGTTVEFQSPGAIAARDEGDGWPARVVGKGPFEVAPGQVTDDTELALALARALAQQGRYDTDAVARAYVAWRRSGPWDCGQATHLAFGLGDPIPEVLADKVAARASRKTQANGALMRVSPLGVFGHAMEPRALATLAALDARLSHPDPLCQAASAVFTVTPRRSAKASTDPPHGTARSTSAPRSPSLSPQRRCWRATRTRRLPSTTRGRAG